MRICVCASGRMRVTCVYYILKKYKNFYVFCWLLNLFTIFAPELNNQLNLLSYGNN